MRPVVRLAVAREVPAQHHTPAWVSGTKPDAPERNREQRHPSLRRCTPLGVPHLVVAVIRPRALRPGGVRLHADRVKRKENSAPVILKRIQQHRDVIVRQNVLPPRQGAPAPASDLYQSTQTPHTASSACTPHTPPSSASPPAHPWASSARIHSPRPACPSDPRAAPCPRSPTAAPPMGAAGSLHPSGAVVWVSTAAQPWVCCPAQLRLTGRLPARRP